MIVVYMKPGVQAREQADIALHLLVNYIGQSFPRNCLLNCDSIRVFVILNSWKVTDPPRVLFRHQTLCVQLLECLQHSSDVLQGDVEHHAVGGGDDQTGAVGSQGLYTFQNG